MQSEIEQGILIEIVELIKPFDKRANNYLENVKVYQWEDFKIINGINKFNVDNNNNNNQAEIVKRKYKLTEDVMFRLDKGSWMLYIPDKNLYYW